MVVSSRGLNAAAASLPTKTHRRAAMGASRHRPRIEAPRAPPPTRRELPLPDGGAAGALTTDQLGCILRRSLKFYGGGSKLPRRAALAAHWRRRRAKQRRWTGLDQDRPGRWTRGCSRGHWPRKLTLSVYLNCPRGTTPRYSATVSLHPVKRNTYAPINICHPTLF